jgi:hypothetical protein
LNTHPHPSCPCRDCTTQVTLVRTTRANRFAKLGALIVALYGERQL